MLLQVLPQEVLYLQMQLMFNWKIFTVQCMPYFFLQLKVDSLRRPFVPIPKLDYEVLLPQLTKCNCPHLTNSTCHLVQSTT